MGKRNNPVKTVINSYHRGGSVSQKLVTSLILLFITVWKKVVRMPRFSFSSSSHLVRPFDIFWFRFLPLLGVWGVLLKPARRLRAPLFISRPPCRPAIRRLSFHIWALGFAFTRLDGSCNRKSMTSHPLDPPPLPPVWSSLQAIGLSWSQFSGLLQSFCRDRCRL